MRKFLIWFVILLFGAVLGAVGAYYLAKKYEEPVREYIVGEVNKRLASEVHVSDINFSLLENFPSASLVMDSVWAEENRVKIGEPDTLFFFEKVFLNLNVLEVIRGSYRIHEIEAHRGFMRLLVDEEGYDNYHIWVQSKDTTGFLLELDEVHVEDAFFRYTNMARDQYYDLFADELFFAGRFSDEQYTMQVDGNGDVFDVALKGTHYLQERTIEVSTALEVMPEGGTYRFKDGTLKVDRRLSFAVSGTLADEGVDLRIQGSELDVIRTLSLIPSESRQSLDQYSSAGSISFDCTLVGAFGKTENPSLKASFSIRNGSIKKEGQKWELTELNGSGTLDNGDRRRFSTTTLSLDELTGRLNGNPFETGFTIDDFDRPAIDGSIKLSSDLASVKEFFELEWMTEGQGGFEIDAKISTVLENPSEPEARDFLNAKASGTIHITDAYFNLKDDHREYAIDDAQFSIEDQALIISRYVGSINASELDLTGRADGFLDYFFTPNGVIDVVGSVKTGALDLDELFPATSDSKSGIVVAFPKRARWKLEVDCDAFRQGKFEAREITGRLKMNHFQVEASDLRFQSQEGEVSGKAGIYRFGENQFGVLTDFTTQDVDIKQLFTTFDNFEQDFITAEVLSGQLDAEIQFQSFCDSLLNLDLQSIVSSVNLNIKDGALTGFKPLIEVADEIKKRPMMRLFVSVEELRNRLQEVHFATLTNEIGIRNGIVSIPHMEIKSSAVNMNVQGTHTFDHRIDYHMDFSLSEVLELKDRKEPYNEYVQRDEEGKTRIFLTMKGTSDDFEVELERTTVGKTLKEGVQQEANAVKELLRTEFNAIAKDSARPEQSEPEELKIEFDPEATNDSGGDNTEETPAEKKPTETKPKLFDKLIKKTETDKKKLKEGEFDDDDF